MLKLGFERSQHDFCLYFKDNIYLVLYVDDALITGQDDLVNELLEKLRIEINVKVMSEGTAFLGMEIVREDNKIKISQKKMIIRVLKEFNMEQSQSIKTPMEMSFNLLEGTMVENIPYRRLICSLMYISLVTRPDIAYSVSYLSRFLDKPTVQAWKAGQRILKYLNATKQLCLSYTKGESNLIGMSDADWGGDRQTRKSVSGFVAFHAGNPIAWHSRKQNCVALSSMEAEYISAASAAQEVMNLKGVLSDFGELHVPVLKVDNMSAISLINTYQNSKRSKHIDIRYHFIKDLCLKKEMLTEYIDTNSNCADMFTKALGKVKFETFRDEILR